MVAGSGEEGSKTGDGAQEAQWVVTCVQDNLLREAEAGRDILNEANIEANPLHAD